MKSFVFNGTEYRSLRECCSKLNISYHKARRLCRHYQRASKDPTVAVKWILGIEKKSAFEVKTAMYEHDLILSEERNYKFKDRMYNLFIDSFING